MRQMASEGVLKSCCNMCYRMCGVLVHLHGGRVIKVAGDPDCPVNRGNSSLHILMVCAIYREVIKTALLRGSTTRAIGRPRQDG
jgi:hypothetical protein